MSKAKRFGFTEGQDGIRTSRRDAGKRGRPARGGVKRQAIAKGGN